MGKFGAQAKLPELLPEHVAEAVRQALKVLDWEQAGEGARDDAEVWLLTYTASFFVVEAPLSERLVCGKQGAGRPKVLPDAAKGYEDQVQHHFSIADVEGDVVLLGAARFLARPPFSACGSCDSRQLAAGSGWP